MPVNAPLAAIPGVEEVMPILKPYNLASREYQPADTVVDVGMGVQVGGGNLAMIAGPCAIEGEEILFEIGRAVKAAGANILRGGAYKPRTSPYSFQGLGEEGLRILRRFRAVAARRDSGHLPVPNLWGDGAAGSVVLVERRQPLPDQEVTDPGVRNGDDGGHRKSAGSRPRIRHRLDL